MMYNSSKIYNALYEGITVKICDYIILETQ